VADPAALWGLGGAIGGVVLAKALDYLTDRGSEDRGQLRKAIDALGVEMRTRFDSIDDDVDDVRRTLASTREQLAGITAVVDGLVVAPLDPRPRRPRG
jgi:hypothetical protein